MNKKKLVPPVPGPGSGGLPAFSNPLIPQNKLNEGKYGTVGGPQA